MLQLGRRCTRLAHVVQEMTCSAPLLSLLGSLQVAHTRSLGRRFRFEELEKRPLTCLAVQVQWLLHENGG